VTGALPTRVVAAQARAKAAGFTLSCEPEVGHLLATLAAAVPDGGRIVELGTGTGVGTAWLVEGLGSRTDVDLVTIEKEGTTSAVARAGDWPAFVTFVVGDAIANLDDHAPYDLVFADAPAGKWWGFDRTFGALRPGGILVVDDMEAAYDDELPYHAEMKNTRDEIVGHPELMSAELAFGTGVILSVRRR
jgi:predicted O-methyltransferase YrrM